MDVRALILRKIKQKGKIKASEIVDATGFSRAYVNRFFRKLRNAGKIALIGKANRAYYVLASEEETAKANIWNIQILKKIKGLTEHDVLRKIKEETGIFTGIKDNIRGIVEYAFSEMLNNAIEHSQSDNVQTAMFRSEEKIWFLVNDWGVGIFNNIMQKKHLNSKLEAIQDLLKGKQTTAPEAHSGEGIFFTSKVADGLAILSSEKRLVFDNIIGDVFVRETKKRRGTKVYFSISLNSKRVLRDVFLKYTTDSFVFDKTQVAVKLFKEDTEYISRSQARRILVGLEKFKKIILDFEGVKTIGQAFADEVFRVWKSNHPKIEITPKNTNENVDFMIKRILPKNNSSF
ncbi:MAG: DUF4325 domain-containing protein [Actinomycetota bacterium]|nr:DUF4325 domain-containing protein [Actinomycetota bacterium]